MPIRDSVFGSGAERKNFHKLVTRWGDTFRVYHNLPFLNVVEPKPGEWLLDGDSGPDLADIIAKRWQITCDQVDQLKKTSIDYVLCDQSDRPLIGIEFDGYGGSSAKSEYLPGMGSPSPREYMTRWKLKVAHGCAFRYVVVNSEEFEDLSRTERSMIVDCLVGSVLALDATHAKAAKFSVTAIGLTEEDWAALSPAGQDQIRQDWLIGAEVSSDLDWDPLTAHLAELERTVGFHPYRTELLSKPTPVAPEGRERVGEFFSARKLGARCYLETPDRGIVEATVWLSNFNFFPVVTVVDNLARLRAMQKLRRLRGARSA